MASTDGISSLQTILGSLSTSGAKETAATKAAQTGKSISPAEAQFDRANFSTVGGLVAQNGSSDVRTAKVAALQQTIANGTYNVSSQDVASKIVEGLLSGR